MIQIEVFGKPFPYAAPKLGRGHAYDPKAKEKEELRWQIRGQYRDEPLPGPIHLDITFFRAIPLNISRTRRLQMLNGRIVPISRPDTSNLIKSYEDCLKGIVIIDDSQCCDVSARQRYSEKPGALIRVMPLVQTISEAALYAFSKE